MPTNYLWRGGLGWWNGGRNGAFRRCARDTNLENQVSSRLPPTIGVQADGGLQRKQHGTEARKILVPRPSGATRDKYETIHSQARKEEIKDQKFLDPSRWSVPYSTGSIPTGSVDAQPS